MADNLRKLVSTESLRSMQDKLENWLREYNNNSCDQNLNYCLELIEQVAKVQGQLFGILTTAAQEGGHYDGVETIKSRLLPWLEASFTAASLGKPVDSKIPSLQDTFDKERQKESVIRDRNIHQLDADLNTTRNQLNQVQDDLAETEKTLEETKNRSAISLLAAEEEINQLRKQLKCLQAQEESRHRPPEHRSSEKRGSERRRVEPRGVDRCGADRSTRSRSPSPASCSRSRSHSHSRSRSHSHSRSGSHSRSHSRNHSRSRSASPSTAVSRVRSPSPNRAKLSSVARKAALLSRFSDAYSQARLDAQCLLRRCIDKAETVQRIIYIATVEAFHVAKMAFRHFKIRVRKSLTPSYAGSNDFEDAVLDYIICHLDLYDSQSSVNDVIRAMNVNPKISFPPEVDFCLLSNFIQEICCIAFAMQTLDPPLDIAFGADGEIFNDCKYRRSYDSDFTAPLVFYHVWPALMENDCVIMKGEAVTRRGAFWNSVRSVTRCRSRSLSPICPRSRVGLSTISRSRSPSPIRCGLPRF
ncbi:mitochondria-eating protein isoform X2 [Sus scrofa]|uniref:mitochondria-eating protein isoform X2 n=1 Tax=Sus scrofa TaxID=9823 RepID=UPI000A2B1F30|nr:mitochondria-eating protein isoform X2 [Sus scrofa]